MCTAHFSKLSCEISRVRNTLLLRPHGQNENVLLTITAREKAPGFATVDMYTDGTVSSTYGKSGELLLFILAAATACCLNEL